jgi:DNA-directed RNA polymerase specialized sigma24 family protein
VVTSSTLVSLNFEWSELVHRVGVPPQTWQSFDALRGVADLDQLLERAGQRPDDTFAALLALGAGGDRLAWRVVFQAMLPKAVRLSRGSEERLAEAVSELWVAIAEYPLARRPRSIAANLAWTLQRQLSPPPVVGMPMASPGPDADHTLQHARALGLLDAEHHRTLWLVYILGLTSAAAAAELGISAELVRYRCSRSVRRLAGQAELLAA